MNKPKTVEEARQAWQDAANALRFTIAEKFPIGCRVSCNLGQFKIYGTVQGHACDWHTNPQMVWVTNEKTGKTRRVSATSGAAELTRLD